MFSDLLKCGGPVQTIESVAKVNLEQHFVGAFVARGPLPECVDSDLGTQWGAATNLQWPQAVPGGLLAGFAQCFGDEST